GPETAIWPRLSLTYYTPLSTDGPASNVGLPQGVKAAYVQAEFKTAINLGRGLWVKDQNDYAFRLGVTYDGSMPTTGAKQSWEDLWTVQLSTDLIDLGTFKPAITFQTGKNGGFKYDSQILIGLFKKLL